MKEGSMTTTRLLTALAASATLVVGAAACGSSSDNSSSGSSGSSGSNSAKVSGTVNGAGSTFAAPVYQQFGSQLKDQGVTLNYQPVGSGAGVAALAQGTAQFAGSDPALAPEDKATLKKGDPVQIPVFFGAITASYNVSGLKSGLKLDGQTLADIFQGKITTWNDPAIAGDNPDATLPDTAITAVHRADDSGTTENFIDYLFQAAGDVWTSEPDGEWPLEGESAQGTSGVIEVVSNTPGGVTYADASRAGELGVASIAVGEEFVAPSAEGAAAVVENSPAVEGRGEYDFAIEVDRLTESTEEYPIVLVSYHIGCIGYDEQEKADNVKAFMDYVISEAGQATAAENAGNAEISAALREQAQTAVDAITVAS
jgi:phosphate transport system substrate-binding protein